MQFRFSSWSLLLIIAICMMACGNPAQQDITFETSEQNIFPKGKLGSASTFTGNAYNYGLVESDSVFNTLAGNVYFEAGARSHWHSHPAGQILIITAGEGYHQIEGQPRETMKKGDVIKCPPNVRHWHGATEKSSLSQLYIVPNTGKGIVNWQEAVTDDQYQSKN